MYNGGFSINTCHHGYWASPVALIVKNLPANGGERHGFSPWFGKIP